MCEVDGDGLMGCPPVPDFWLVKYHFTSTFSDVHKIKNSFTRLGFRVFEYENDPYRVHIKISHTKPTYLTLWFLENDELIKQRRLKVTYYVHNTRSYKRKKCQTSSTN